MAKLTDLIKIESVDLSSIFIQEISNGSTRLRFKQPLILNPNLDPKNGQLFVVTQVASYLN